jgi:hypothetical protein
VTRIIYQKRNGEIFERIRNTYITYRIGDTTSMGWKVLDIQYKYKNKYYSSMEYDRVINENIKRRKKIMNFKKQFYNMYKNLIYCASMLIFIRVFEMFCK